MLAASPLPPVLAPTGAPAASLQSPALSQAQAASHITYFAPPPALGSNPMLNQRQAQVQGNTGQAANAATASTAQAVISSSGLHPASQQPVVREFGYSSAFMAQWIDQSISAADSAKYLPSRAGAPAAPAPMPAVQELVARVASQQRQPASQPVSVGIEAAPVAPTRQAAALLAQPQAIQLNIGQMTQAANVVHQQASAAVEVLARVSSPSTSSAGSASDERGGTSISARAQRARDATKAYGQAINRMRDMPVPVRQNDPSLPVAAVAEVGGGGSFRNIAALEADALPEIVTLPDYAFA